MTPFAYRFITGAMLSTLFLLTSCSEDFLETNPTTLLPAERAFDSPEKVLAQVNNLYGKLQNPNFYGGRFIIFNEQRAGEFGQNDGNAATGSAIWNQNVASTSEYVNDLWAAAYSAINASNILMDQMGKQTVVSDSVAKHYKAEARFVRALCYLSLVQTFARPYRLDPNAPGVPLRIQPITSAGNNDLARSSVGEVYARIIEDLDAAEATLPECYGDELRNVTRARRSNAIALKTRIFLNMGLYERVVEEFRKIVPSQPPFRYASGCSTHALEADVASLFSGNYTGVEALFSIAFANTTTETPPPQYALAFNYVTQPIIFLAPEGIGYHEAFNSAEDARSKLRGVSPAGHPILTKFKITSAPFRDYVPVMRYAEVLLNGAEALTYLGELESARELLKALRHRSDPSYAFSDSEITTAEQIQHSLATERRVEFLGEGLRLQDLQRQLLPLPSKTGSIGRAPEVPVHASNYIWPIPSGELSTNRLCIPN
ncbi:MAG: RagB/SusD family nutrient uptake outer membrane protein [Saprospiraceae bacterium]|nr:RagB/SusD family nutrient uptake outer membrane protein [Saprospiraceae bacterium]MBP9210431.1 RagB/SusD family nutrient uptake outer membrane protein [Saprospiraceae bacterium]MBV6472396.1 hypothetical protein [Saprospiraceae bacterium]